MERAGQDDGPEQTANDSNPHRKSALADRETQGHLDPGKERLTEPQRRDGLLRILQDSICLGESGIKGARMQMGRRD